MSIKPGGQQSSLGAALHAALAPFTRRRAPLTCVLLCLLVLMAQALAAQAVPVQDSGQAVGYLEGTLTRTDGETAIVELSEGRTVEAELGSGRHEDFGGAIPQFEVGQRVELYYAPAPSSNERQYVVTDWVRRPALGWLVALFLLVSVAVARLKGLRAFVSTAASLAIVVLFIVPQILQGSNPFLVSLVGAGGILVLAIYFVHGLSWSTTAALLGTAVAVLVTMLLGVAFTDWAHLTGFGSEEAMILSSGASQVDLKGLLLAGLLVGALGALTDTTIVQASAIRELAHLSPGSSWGELYRRGMNIGRDHIGSLVNTLVLAYTGAALPLFLLLTLNDFPLTHALNLELVASEVVHTLVGSIGLMLSVPLTTVVAAFMFHGDRLPLADGELEHTHHH